MGKIRKYHHYDTPHRCKLKGVFEYHDKIGMPLSSDVKHRIFSIMNTSKASEYNILRGADRTRHNDTTKCIETRERKSKMTRKEMTEADKILKDDDINNKALT